MSIIAWVVPGLAAGTLAKELIRGAPPVIGTRRVQHAQPPLAREGRVYQDEPPL